MLEGGDKHSISYPPSCLLYLQENKPFQLICLLLPVAAHR